MDIELVDVEGAVRSWLTGYPGLTGAGGALVAGVHLGQPRSPAKGAVAGMTLVGPRSLSDVSDDARVSFRVQAVGSERGVRELVGSAMRALIRAVLALQDGGRVVQTRRGDWVRLLVAGDTTGPIDGGDYGGEYSQVFDALFRCQATSIPYGAGVYGAGPYGG